MEEYLSEKLNDLSINDETKELINKMTEWESLGQGIIMGQKIIVELDKRRQKCREALRKLRQESKDRTKRRSKSWLCFGDTTFVKVASDKATQMIEDDIKIIETTLEGTREEIRRRVDELKKMENSKSLDQLGFNLLPITQPLVLFN
ncbi:unnamed protein product [Thelazia callipaeda]|uniref:P53 and DNA damage-regulated protein 1 n=1 Tax=Thelazia callipaeda TaxID=103827 RepID=A0A0N5CXI7_THECL|nr:unnamed protein product [Thelazia callipaeda]